MILAYTEALHEIFTTKHGQKQQNQNFEGAEEKLRHKQQKIAPDKQI